MRFEVSSCLIFASSVFSLSLPFVPFAGQTLQKKAPFDYTSTTNTSSHAALPSHGDTSVLPNDSECFERPEPGEIRFPPDQQDCYAAAQRISRLGRWSRPLVFKRGLGGNVNLPVDIRYGSCYIHINMVHAGDEDIMTLETVYSAALEIGIRCCSPIGRWKYGGSTMVGPRGLLYIIVGGRADANQMPASVQLSRGELEGVESNSSSVDGLPAVSASSFGRQENRQPVATNTALVARHEPVSSASSSLSISLPNTAVSAAVTTAHTLNTVSSKGSAFALNISPVNITSSAATSDKDPQIVKDHQDCFNGPTQVAALIPTKLEDCRNAAEDLLQDIEPFQPITFARRYRAGFSLPQLVRSGSCVISVDVLNEKDYDYFMPVVVELAAIDLARRCTTGLYHGGGRTAVGPKKVVNVAVSFGRGTPAENGAMQLAPSNTPLVARDSIHGAATDALSISSSSVV